ncbi:MAG: YjbH domain-containing protein, partial [Alphaproteobacteria bacterium]|nr:YjbH domain-containing protein [Alphaproteobacteria bacterium]
MGGLVIVAAALLHVRPVSAQAQSDGLRNTFGEIGILDMPSAHMAPDGQLAFTMGDIGVYQRYSLSFQALPWLETSFRYSHVPGWSVDQPQYYDRSFGMKMRLLKESSGLPDVSFGIRDLFGTGVYSSEYLAASKQIGDLDFTAGLGWGRLADNNTLPNPFGLAFHSFKTRSAGSSGLANFGQYFHGTRAGVFGGVVWQTPIDDLKLLAEYSSDKYTGEAQY